LFKSKKQEKIDYVNSIGRSSNAKTNNNKKQNSLMINHSNSLYIRRNAIMGHPHIQKQMTNSTISKETLRDEIYSPKMSGIYGLYPPQKLEVERRRIESMKLVLARAFSSKFSRNNDARQLGSELKKYWNPREI